MEGLIFKEDTHQYFFDGVEYPSVTVILQKTGFIDVRWFTEYGRDRGSLVHQIVHWYILDELDGDTVDPALQGYLDAWKLFESDTGYISITVEKPMVNYQYGFGGTPDNIGLLNNKQSILDYKSGQISAWTGLQLAGYEILDGTRLKRFGLQLKDNGKYSLKEFSDRKDREIFLAALSCYHWQLNHK